MANRLAREGAGHGEAVKERRDPRRREAGQGQLRQSTAMGHLRLHKRRMRQARSEADEDEQRVAERQHAHGAAVMADSCGEDLDR
jgi:hypothetical protein